MSTRRIERTGSRFGIAHDLRAEKPEWISHVEEPPANLHENAEGSVMPNLREIPDPSSTEIRAFFADRTLFRTLSREALEQLEAIASSKAVRAGGDLYVTKEDPRDIHFLFAGRGRLVKVGADGRTRILHTVVPGEIIDVVSLFDSNGNSATYVAETDCTLVSFHGSELLRFLERSPQACLAILGRAVARLRDLTGIVEQLTLEETTERLWSYLFRSSRATGVNEYPRIVDSLPTRERIAEEIGTVREVVSRRLSQLVKKGAIHIAGRQLTLLKTHEEKRPTRRIVEERQH